MCRPEINIKPWETLSKDLRKGNEKVKWTDRERYAYWKGNPVVAETRMALLKCNVSEKQDWNARLYAQVSSCAKLRSYFFVKKYSFSRPLPYILPLPKRKRVKGNSLLPPSPPPSKKKGIEVLQLQIYKSIFGVLLHINLNGAVNVCGTFLSASLQFRNLGLSDSVMLITVMNLEITVGKVECKRNLSDGSGNICRIGFKNRSKVTSNQT